VFLNFPCTKVWKHPEIFLRFGQDRICNSLPGNSFLPVLWGIVQVCSISTGNCHSKFLYSKLGRAVSFENCCRLCRPLLPLQGLGFRVYGLGIGFRVNLGYNCCHLFRPLDAPSDMHTFTPFPPLPLPAPASAQPLSPLPAPSSLPSPSSTAS
jgi:hypothetical protein